MTAIAAATDFLKTVELVLIVVALVVWLVLLTQCARTTGKLAFFTVPLLSFFASSTVTAALIVPGSIPMDVRTVFILSGLFRVMFGASVLFAIVNVFIPRRRPMQRVNEPTDQPMSAKAA